MDMREITQYSPDALRNLVAQEQQAGRKDSLNRMRNALRAVSAENKLASVDRSEVSTAARGGRFSFSFKEEVSASWEGSYSFNSGPPATFESNFSFSFSVKQSLEVEFAEGLDVSSEKISGEDFEFNREGILTLLERLIDKLSAEDRPQLDLGGEIDGRAMDLLQQLGLIDEEGKATPALQMLSDYAGLNRFESGKQVNVSAGFTYSARMNSTQLNWQGWNQRQGASLGGISSGSGSTTAVNSGETAGGTSNVTSGVGGANTVTGNNVGGDVNIDDRDVININITTGD
jgi:hypothetical protein